MEPTSEARHPEQTFFPDPAVDRVLGVVMALATEVYVLRDRTRALEAQLVARGQVDRTALDAEPDAETLAAVRADRDAFVQHLLQPLMGQQVSRGVARGAVS